MRSKNDLDLVESDQNKKTEETPLSVENNSSTSTIDDQTLFSKKHKKLTAKNLVAIIFASCGLALFVVGLILVACGLSFEGFVVALIGFAVMFVALVIFLYKKTVRVKHKTGKLLKKLRAAAWLCLLCGFMLLGLGIGFIFTNSAIEGLIFGGLGFFILILSVIFYGMQRDVCHNCGESFGKVVSRTPGGVFEKVGQTTISKFEFDQKKYDKNSTVWTDGNGNYYQKTLSTTSAYGKILECPKCGHVWKGNDVEVTTRKI